MLIPHGFRPDLWRRLGRMGDFLAFLVIAGALAAILGAFGWLARRVRRRGTGGALMGPLDEIYHPAAHRFRFEIQVLAERMEPLPSAEDQHRGGEPGRPGVADR
jgi:hypothetical protein